MLLFSSLPSTVTLIPKEVSKKEIYDFKSSSPNDSIYSITFLPEGSMLSTAKSLFLI